MTCVREKVEEYEYSDDEEQVMLRRALALSLEGNDNDIEDGPQKTLSLSLRGEINDRPEEVESIPHFMSFGAPIPQVSSFSESPQSTFYPDLNDQYKQWMEQQRMFGERRCSRYFLEDLCSYLYFLIKAACFFILLMILVFIIVAFIQLAMTFRSDINKEFEIIASDIYHQAQKCTMNYVTNRCAPETRAPFLEENCTKWEKCMNRDPYNSIRTAEVVAGLIARLISAFVTQLTYKTMIFLFIINLIFFGTILHRFT